MPAFLRASMPWNDVCRVLRASMASYMNSDCVSVFIMSLRISRHDISHYKTALPSRDCERIVAKSLSLSDPS